MQIAIEIESILKLIPYVNNIYIGVSGGVDSMVLLHIMSKYKEYKNITAVHVNHNIHYMSSDMERLVRKESKLLGVNYQPINIYIDKKSNIESKARKLRYESIINIMSDKSILLTAHHISDQVENIFLSIKRGSGIEGLCGINKITNLNNNKLLIRPFLNINKDMILKYAKDNNIKYLNDPTNIDINFDRNFIRHNVLPIINSRWSYFEEKVKNTSILINNYVEATNEIIGNTLLNNIITSNYGLSLTLIKNYSKTTQLILIRYWLKLLKQPMPTQKQLISIYNQFNDNNSKKPKFKMLFSEIYKYKETLYVIPYDKKDVNLILLPSNSMEWIKLPYSMGRLAWSVKKPQNTISFTMNLPLPTDNEYIISFNPRNNTAPFSTNILKKSQLKKQLQALGLPYWCRIKSPNLERKKDLNNHIKVSTWYILWEWWYRPEDVSYNFL